MKTVIIRPQALGDELVEIEGDAFRHLFRASRLAVGDPLRLVDGAGNARQGIIREVTRRRAVVSVGGVLPAGEPGREVEIWVPMPRPSRASWMVEKLTEVGVAAIRFYASRHAPRSSGTNQLRRLERVAASALQQCGRSRLPALTGDCSWQTMLRALRDEAQWFVLDPASAGWSSFQPGTERVALIVGPEGGWTAEESADLRRAGGRSVQLGSTVLRVETAAVVGAAMALQGF
jgi:16S rRNA (uracil1498-N3)-methyltransferase